MIPRDVKSPTTPIPFHKLLKGVAVVHLNDEQAKQLVAHIEADNFQERVDGRIKFHTYVVRE